MELPTCDSVKLGSCGHPNLVCQDGTNKCKCAFGFLFNNKSETLDDACLKTLSSNTPADKSSHNPATTIIVTLILLALIVTALVFTVRRYNLMHWFRQNVISRRDNNVMYEDVMIGQDDPPITA